MAASKSKDAASMEDMGLKVLQLECIIDAKDREISLLRSSLASEDGGASDLSAKLQDELKVLQTQLGEKEATISRLQAQLQHSPASGAEGAAPSSSSSGSSSPDEVLTLNVSGQEFFAQRSTLLQVPGSQLHCMFDPQGSSKPLRDSQGRFFLPYQPEAFGAILSCLQALQVLGLWPEELPWPDRLQRDRRLLQYTAKLLAHLGLQQALGGSLSSLPRSGGGGGGTVVNGMVAAAAAAAALDTAEGSHHAPPGDAGRAGAGAGAAPAGGGASAAPKMLRGGRAHHHHSSGGPESPRRGGGRSGGGSGAKQQHSGAAGHGGGGRGGGQHSGGDGGAHGAAAAAGGPPPGTGLRQQSVEAAQSAVTMALQPLETGRPMSNGRAALPQQQQQHQSQPGASGTGRKTPPRMGKLGSPTAASSSERSSVAAEAAVMSALRPQEPYAPRVGVSQASTAAAADLAREVLQGL